MPRPIQPSAFSYLLPTLVQSGVNSQSSGASGWTPGGALSLQIPDNTVIGGNPRGLGAVDLQTQRTAATQVASGAGSFVAGVNSTASGQGSTAMGSSTASGDYSIAMGQSTASGLRSAAMGNATASNIAAFAVGLGSATNQRTTATGGSSASGTGATAMGFASSANNTYTTAMGNSTASIAYSTAMGISTTSQQAATAMGNSTASGQYSVSTGQSTASGQYSAALGYSTAAQIGKFSYSGGVFAASGDAQTGKFVARVATTDATPTVLTSDGTAAGTGNQLILSNSSAFTFSILVVGRQQAAGGTASAAWEIKGLIRREANAAATTLVNSATTVIDNTPGWAVAVSADTTNGGLAITVTGAAATNIRWVATAYTSEVIYA